MCSETGRAEPLTGLVKDVHVLSIDIGLMNANYREGLYKQ